ncbi:MAG: hypothetical protein PHT79_01550 [Syntrophomonadaceae bacterium]|nr:hypothetical protein [Syntrophomonadaceae bacterium]
MSKVNEFITGINYWPVHKAMYWWKDFDPQEVKDDFTRLAEHNFQVIRIFLTWEDFQPEPDKISPACLKNLQYTADIAASCNLQIMPTFFCGHMSGVNWMPRWMLKPGGRKGRFPVYSEGQLYQTSTRSFYDEPEILEAELLQIEHVCLSLKGHEAIKVYDLGNESSNCSIPAHREQARKWLELMSTAIRLYSDGAKVTLGMHAEDLEENRHLWPQDAALYCDFLCMHGYPFYLSWLEDNFDVHILPFLGIITRWLSNNKPVLFQEFGAPSRPLIPPFPEDNQIGLKCPLWSESLVSNYYLKALQLLYQENMLGAFAWCSSDYHPQLWNKPPLEKNQHERHFGLFRHNGSPKPAATVFKELNNYLTSVKHQPDKHLWLADFNRDTFYGNPKENLRKMYALYKQELSK